jgi:Holliday junction resolvase RusA-like endonuclease
MNQFNSNGYLNALQGPIMANVVFHVPIPGSWSQKRKEEASGEFVATRPDIDNYEKFYFDVMNGLAYKDDSQIVKTKTQKIYSTKPHVEINLHQLAVRMINEHAITYKNNLNVENLDYIIKKANKLGLIDRRIARVYQQQDVDGVHVYFEVDGPKQRD